jgi:DNA-binding MarR family transcriptional regulator
MTLRKADPVDDLMREWGDVLGVEPPQALEITQRVMRTARQLDKCITATVTASGLTARNDYEILAALRRSPEPNRPSELAQLIGVTRAAIAQRVDVLVDAGLVARGDHPDDRRSSSLTLTARGRTLVADIRERSFALQSSAVKGISNRNWVAVVESLRLLESNLEAILTPTGPSR